jgi:hypothetical protein
MNAFPFFIFFLIAIDYPLRRAKAKAPVKIAEAEDGLLGNDTILVPSR